MEYIGSLEYDESLKKTNGIVIFGGGDMLPTLLKKLEGMKLAGEIIAICDNNVSLQGKEILGIPVLCLDYILEEYRDLDFVVYNRYSIEICKQLLENHVTKIHLIRQGSL